MIDPSILKLPSRTNKWWFIFWERPVLLKVLKSVARVNCSSTPPYFKLLSSSIFSILHTVKVFYCTFWALCADVLNVLPKGGVLFKGIYPWNGLNSFGKSGQFPEKITKLQFSILDRIFDFFDFGYYFDSTIIILADFQAMRFISKHFSSVILTPFSYIKFFTSLNLIIGRVLTRHFPVAYVLSEKKRIWVLKQTNSKSFDGGISVVVPLSKLPTIINRQLETYFTEELSNAGSFSFDHNHFLSAINQKTKFCSLFQKTERFSAYFLSILIESSPKFTKNGRKKNYKMR